MMFVYWSLGFLLVLAIVIVSFGFYEFLVEEKLDRARFNRMNQAFHLKHLDEINNGNK